MLAVGETSHDRTVGPNPARVYGTTEAGIVTRASSAEWLAREGTVGKAWPGRVLKILEGHGDLGGRPPSSRCRVGSNFAPTCRATIPARQQASYSAAIFLTVKDETGIANLVIWPKLSERQRRVVLSAGMIAVHDRIRIQRVGEVSISSLIGLPIYPRFWRVSAAPMLSSHCRTGVETSFAMAALDTICVSYHLWACGHATSILPIFAATYLK